MFMNLGLYKHGSDLQGQQEQIERNKEINHSLLMKTRNKI